MTRYILVYGAIAAAIVSAMMVLNISFVPGEYGNGSQAVGYLSMVLAFAFIFVAIKRYRDFVLGGVIRFWPAFRLGLAIVAIATISYVVVWEVFLAVTGSDWMEQYIAGAIEAERAKGVGEAAVEAFAERMRSFAELYENWWFRAPMTALEILPVGLLIGVISALVLRNPGVLPRRV